MVCRTPSRTRTLAFCMLLTMISLPGFSSVNSPKPSLASESLPTDEGAPAASATSLARLRHSLESNRSTCAALALLLLGLYAALWFRIQRIKKVLRERMEERHAERERIARDLHDTLM